MKLFECKEVTEKEEVTPVLVKPVKLSHYNQELNVSDDGDVDDDIASPVDYLKASTFQNSILAQHTKK